MAPPEAGRWGDLRHLADTVEGLSSLLADALGRSGGLSHTIKPMWPAARLAGRAVTAKPTDRDLTAVFRAIETCRPGDVLVVADPVGLPVAMWGENATRYAQRYGVVGAVLGTPVRDIAAHARLGFPIFALGATPLAARFEGGGEVGVPITVGGIAVRPGDALVGDEDGVVAVPGVHLEGALARISALLAADRATQAAIAAGGRFPWRGGEG